MSVPYSIPIEIEHGLSNPSKLPHKNCLKSLGYFDLDAIRSMSSCVNGEYIFFSITYLLWV